MAPPFLSTCGFLRLVGVRAEIDCLPELGKIYVRCCVMQCFCPGTDKATFLCQGTVRYQVIDRSIIYSAFNLLHSLPILFSGFH